MTIENPERLCAHVEMDGAGLVVDFIVADVSHLAAMRQSGGPHGSPLSVAVYVRADVADEQTAAALRGEAHEVAALRAEVEALRSGEFVRAVATERNAYREALKKVDALMVPGVAWEPWEAKEVAKAALAGKGAG